MEGKDEKQAENSLSEQQRTELSGRLSDINKKLLTMEWDRKHNQLNAGMETKYAQLKEEHDKIIERISPKQS